jgi:hypothetical protein
MKVFRGSSSSEIVVQSLTALHSLSPAEYAALSQDLILSLLQFSTREAILDAIRQAFKDAAKLGNTDSSFEGEGYKTTRDRLIALLREEDEDECRPTSHAFTTAWELITDTTRQLQKGFPKASVAADDEGGIRLRWRSLDRTREVSLYCPSSPSEKAYIYHEVGDEYDADYKVSDLALAKWLSWLPHNE